MTGYVLAAVALLLLAWEAVTFTLLLGGTVPTYLLLTGSFVGGVGLGRGRRWAWYVLPAIAVLAVLYPYVWEHFLSDPGTYNLLQNYFDTAGSWFYYALPAVVVLAILVVAPAPLPVRVFRTARLTKIVLSALALPVSGLALVIIAVMLLWGLYQGDSRAWNLVGASAAPIGGLGILSWRAGQARLEVRDRSVVVVNVLGRHTVPLEDIDRFEIGESYWGISLVLRDGRRIVVNGIQKPKIMRRLNRRAAADAMIEELNGLLRRE